MKKEFRYIIVFQFVCTCTREQNLPMPVQKKMRTTPIPEIFLLLAHEEKGWSIKDLVSNFDSFHEFRGRTLGIIGLGAIGSKVAKLANAFGARVIYYKRNRLSIDEETRAREGAYLINTSRPGVIDEQAVAAALQEVSLSGAGIDGVNTRTVDGLFITDSPLSECHNVVITPHIAGPTREAKVRGWGQRVENVCRFLNGEKPLYLLNDVWPEESEEKSMGRKKRG